MYERFTDRARKVMQLANNEAQRFNHEYIGTEHILLGLIKEDTGVAACVLKNLDVDLRTARLQVEKLVQSEPDTGAMGKLPQTPRAHRVLDHSIEEARNLNHNHVGTEHILLGLLREQEGVAAQVLMNLGLKLEEVREEVLRLLGCESIEKAMETKPLHEIEADLDHKENAETGDVTLTGEPPEEPLTNPLESVPDPMGNLTCAIARLAVSSDDAADVFRNVTTLLDCERQNLQQKNETINDLQETIRVMRAESTKMRKESVPLGEEYLERSLACVINHIDLMLDKASTPTTVTNSGFWAKGICDRLTTLARLSTLVEESKTASAECCKPQSTPPDEPQAQAILAGLLAVEQANRTETPTDADKA